MPAGLPSVSRRVVVAAAVAGLLSPVMAAHAAVSPDVDATAVTLVMVVMAGSVGTVPGAVPVSFSGSCLGPFVDAASASSGALTTSSCGDVGSTAAGTFDYVSCTTGVLGGSASFTEPSGETVTARSFVAAFVGGVGVVVASPAAPSGGGYADDGSTGSAVGVALMMPLDSPACGPPGETLFGIDAVFAAENGTGA